MRGYTKEHAWVETGEDVATVGITIYAQEQLGDIVYVDLPKAGLPVEQDKSFGTVESVKSVSELISPVSGTVVEANARLGETPELLNQDPEGSAWLLKVKLNAPLGPLLTAEEYAAFTKSAS